MEYEYPTDDQLAELRKLADGFATEDDLIALVNCIERLWWMPNWGFVRKGQQFILHTGGWSGNENVIEILQDTMFWMCFWRAALCGGHYYFELPTKDYWNTQ